MTQTSAERVYLDANLFIYLVEGEPEFQRAARSAVATVIETGGRFATSELSIGECLKGAPAQAHAPRVIDAYRAWFDGPLVDLMPITRAIIESAAADTRLKLFDAIHVATAEAAGCSAVITNDRRWRSVAGLRVIRPSG